MNFRHIYLYLPIVLLTLNSCTDDEEAKLLEYSMTVRYPESFKDQLAEGVKVEITNAFTGDTKSQKTDATGTANFTELLEGTYNLAVSKDLSIMEALEQTGLEEEVYLNGAKNNIGIYEDRRDSIVLQSSNVGGWVIKEIYYTGAPESGYYSNDQFFEIYNNSVDVLYADSLCIGNVVGRPYVSSSSRPSGFKDDEEYIYFQNILMVPGDGTTYPVEPGESVIIARTAINHKDDEELGSPTSPVNLGAGIADFECYWEPAGRDFDNPDVTNLEIIYFAIPTIFDWFPSVFGPSIAIFKHEDPMSLPRFTEPGSSSDREYPQVPVENIIDGIDCIRNSTVTEFKRLPSFIDAGFQYCTDSYTGESLRRKVKTEVNGRKVLQDSNNSTDDFERLEAPTPHTFD